MFKSKKEDYSSFMKGKLISLEAVDDFMFAQKMLGDGFAIKPAANEVYAPISGKITALFPTGHAYGITQKNGIEILLHLGIDTVELGGDGFISKVSVGENVKQGQLLAEMDIEFLKSKQVDVTSMLVFTSGQKVELLKENKTVEALETQIIKVK